MSGLSDYTDIREHHPRFDTAECKKCDKEVYVPWDFNHDYSFCAEHSPLKSRPMWKRVNGDRVEVRI